ncbi:MAG TPA: zf-TFIIB domain-containing protein [Longimicrobium sp.]|nr:zf-TFIIB domain-containing protein [Longimicrobium sp.]
MRKPAIRLECPACLGVPLEVMRFTHGASVRHCRRCGGTWIVRGQIPRLRTVSSQVMRTIIRRAEDAGFLCHACHVPMDRDAAECEACGRDNALECPDCGKPLRRQTERGVTVDVCGPCEAVWLDHHELSAIWAGAATLAVAQASSGNNLALTPDADLLEIFVHAPDLAVGAVRGAAHAAQASVEAAANAPEMLSAVPDALGALLEIAGNVAGAVFELILEVICGILEGFSI